MSLQRNSTILLCRMLTFFIFLVNQAQVEETLKRIEASKGVIGTILVNAEGIPIRTTLDNSTTVQYAELLCQLSMLARTTVRDIDPQNDLTFLRIRSKKHEIMVALGEHVILLAFGVVGLMVISNTNTQYDLSQQLNTFLALLLLLHLHV
uniref:Dynein light chain roadblock-type 2 n=1 Tax=Amphiprion percula TaxID=161767 RepID=A0A3P8S402_AMPPE